jgi:hypothetical protein
MRGVPLRPARVARRLFLLGTLAALCGCQKEEDVRRYKAPKEQAGPPVATAPAETEGVPTRLLGAIIPHGAGLWVFKLMGPDEAVKPHQAEFESFVDSVTFKGDKPDFKVPEGWRESEGTKINGQRLSVAAFRVGPEAEAPELTVTPSKGSVLANINRWRGQLSLPPVDEAGLKEISKEKKVGDATAVLVNLTGTGSGGMGQPPFAGKAHPPVTKAGVAVTPIIKYTLPAGWEEGGELVKSGIPRLAVFQVKDGSRTAEVSVTIAGGGVKENIDRWRRQVGLPPLEGDKLKAEAVPILIGDNPALLVDLSGDGKADHKGILAAVMPKGQNSWFFKLDGPADIAARQKSAFEAFLKSVRFEGGDAQ